MNSVVLCADFVSLWWIVF